MFVVLSAAGKKDSLSLAHLYYPWQYFIRILYAYIYVCLVPITNVLRILFSYKTCGRNKEIYGIIEFILYGNTFTYFEY